MALSADRGLRPVRIANCSGFFGDRLSAAQEMVEGGPIDVLTGDWLAELTMLILHKQRARNAEAGYAHTFVSQMEQVLGTCIERGIRVVSNAGGLNPAGCAERIRKIGEGLGLDVAVAHLEGDDLMAQIDRLTPQLHHLDDGRPLEAGPISANAYLGGWGIARALHEGADVVITGRVTDAALVVGPAAWWWDWSTDDLDALAGAVAAGHVIECGAQATGGNYAFFSEIPDLDRAPGFPIAEVERDGSSIITKHPGTGGLISTGTITAQLLYEIGAPEYANPDVIARFDTLQLSDEGNDRVRISQTKGLPPSGQLKVSINLEGGYRNRMTFVLTGLDQRAKADWLLSGLVQQLGGNQRLVDAGIEIDTRLVTADPFDERGQEFSSGLLHVTVKGPDERLVGRAFSSAAIELALANYPGFFATSAPSSAQSYGVFWPALVNAGDVDHIVVLQDGRRIRIEHPRTLGAHDSSLTSTSDGQLPIELVGVTPLELPVGQPLGNWFAARSGDKGGNANIGLWAREPAAYAWLAERLTADRLGKLLPEAANLEIRRHEFPNLLAVNFVIYRYLGEGVASSTAFDPQAKGLGEYVRSRLITEEMTAPA